MALVLGGSVSAGEWPALTNKTLTVFQKNAITPRHFLHCTARFVPHTFEDVIFDLGPNLCCGSGAIDDFITVIEKVRCLSQASRIGIIAWPGNEKGKRKTLLSLGEVAERTRALLIKVPHEKKRYNQDGTHPNWMGHLGIAKRVASFLDAPRSSAAQDEWNCLHDSSSEVCIPNATRIAPIGETKWKLVDESPIATVQKHGWLSTAANEMFTFAVPTMRTCGTIGTIAYLSTNSSGTFDIICSCQCSHIRAFAAISRAYPFPRVQTRTERTVKVTAETEFYILSQGSCMVTILHVDGSKVRIDGVYFREPSRHEVWSAANGSRATKAQRRFGRLALAPCP